MDENMIYEAEVMDVDNVEEFEVEEGRELSTGVAVLIGAAITGAAIGAVKLGKKALSKIKEKRAIAKTRHEMVPADEAEEA